MSQPTQELICTVCPKGCRLLVYKEGDTLVRVDAGCLRGKRYAEQELSDPRRMVASTVKISGASHTLLPVYTSAPFPKPQIQELMSALRQINLQAPVHSGDVVAANMLGTGIDILASRDMPVQPLAK